MQELSAEEAVVASHASPQLGPLTVLEERIESSRVSASCSSESDRARPEQA